MEYLFFKIILADNYVYSIDWMLTNSLGVIIESGKAIIDLADFTFEFIRFLLAVSRCDLLISNQMTTALKMLGKEMNMRGLSTERKNVPKFDISQYIKINTDKCEDIKNIFFANQLHEKQVA